MAASAAARRSPLTPSRRPRRRLSNGIKAAAPSSLLQYESKACAPRRQGCGLRGRLRSGERCAASRARRCGGAAGPSGVRRCGAASDDTAAPAARYGPASSCRAPTSPLPRTRRAVSKRSTSSSPSRSAREEPSLARAASAPWPPRCSSLCASAAALCAARGALGTVAAAARDTSRRFAGAQRAPAVKPRRGQGAFLGQHAPHLARRVAQFASQTPRSVARVASGAPGRRERRALRTRATASCLTRIAAMAHSTSRARAPAAEAASRFASASTARATSASSSASAA